MELNITKFNVVVAAISSCLQLDLDLCSSHCFGVVSVSVCPMHIYMHGNGRHACKMFSRHFSITVQRNHLRFGGVVGPNSDYLSRTLGPCSSFSFGIVSVLLSRFDAPFKCTAD